MTVSLPETNVFTELALAGDVDGAGSLVDDLLSAGTSIPLIVEGLLVPSQRIIGERWLAGTITVADEHLATTVSHACIENLNARVSAYPVDSRLVMLCPAGERHFTSASFLALGLRSQGWDADFMRQPPDEDILRQRLRRSGVTAVAISATLPQALVNVPPLVALAHREGLPVIVGGQAFGTHGLRAALCGADAHAPSIADSVVVLNEWRDQRPQVAEQQAAGDQHAAQQILARMQPYAKACAAQLQGHDAIATTGRDVRVDIAVRDMVASAASAVALADPTICADHMEWLKHLAREDEHDLLLEVGSLVSHLVINDFPSAATHVDFRMQTRDADAAPVPPAVHGDASPSAGA